jgi:hypothetical protein
LVSSADFADDTNPVGARLAREEAGTSNIDASSEDAIASKPAPTGLVSSAEFVDDTKPCRSEPARDEAGTSGIDVNSEDAIAGKPAPTEIQDFGPADHRTLLPMNRRSPHERA